MLVILLLAVSCYVWWRNRKTLLSLKTHICRELVVPGTLSLENMIVFNWPIGKLYGCETAYSSYLLKVRGQSRASGRAHCLAAMFADVY